VILIAWRTSHGASPATLVALLAGSLLARAGCLKFGLEVSTLGRVSAMTGRITHARHSHPSRPVGLLPWTLAPAADGGTPAGRFQMPACGS